MVTSSWMASTSLPEGAEMRAVDATIAEFIRHQEAQVVEIVRLQEAQVALLKRMFGSSHAVAAASTNHVEVDPKKETSAIRVDCMQSGQDEMAVPTVAPKEEEGEIIKEKCEEESLEDPLKVMDLCEVSDIWSPWGTALYCKDCKSLMAQLKEDPSLMMQTRAGRTVLHVASIYGCQPLEQQVLQNIGKSILSEVVNWESDTLKGYDAVVNAVDEVTKLTAYDINEYFVCQDYPTRDGVTDDGVTDDVKRSTTTNDLDAAEFVGCIRDVVKQIMFDETNHGISELKDFIKDEKSYNFEEKHREFMFHQAWYHLWIQTIWAQTRASKQLNEIEQAKVQGIMDYLRSVVSGCLKMSKGRSILKFLLELQNWRGNPPFQTIIEEIGSHNHFLDIDFMISNFKNLLESSELDLFQTFVNARDVRGWTFLHKCSAWGFEDVVEKLVKEESIDLNPTLPNSCATPLHLAILHNHPHVVKALLKGKIDMNVIFKRSIVHGEKNGSGMKRCKDQWSPLQLAAIMGFPNVVRELLSKVDEIYDVGKRKNKLFLRKDNPWLEAHDDKVSALHMAAASGIPEVLRLFLNDGTFDPLKLTKEEKRSALHFATDTTTPCFFNQTYLQFQRGFGYGHPLVDIFDFATVNHHAKVIKDCERDGTINMKSHCRTKEEYGGKIACVTMLLQSGIDVWHQDVGKNYAEPGAQASTDVRLWWYERIAQEILEAKRNLNDAANAISVVAALVATASYVGPLQPPLGYANDPSDPNSDLVQVTKLAIRVFVVSNCLSFYLAIGSIMFAIVPALPMPQEGMFEEWQRSRRSVGLAMSFLLLSILGNLVSFAAASNVGMSNYYSWQHVGLVFYPTLVGVIACLFGIIIFFIRMLRLIFDKNESIRYLYQKLAKLV